MKILDIFKQKHTAALIGLGRIGFSLGNDKKREQPASHTMALLDSMRIKLVAGADKDIQTADEWKNFITEKKIDAKTFYSSKELYDYFFKQESENQKSESESEGEGENQESEKTISEVVSEKPEIIVIAVNESSHLEEAINAIKFQPKLVILEKPVALNVLEAYQIKAVAEQYNVPVMVNHERRFAKDYKLAKEFLPRIGEIQSVKAELCSGLRVYAPQFEKDGSYSLLHDGTHLIDILHYLLKIELVAPQLLNVFRDDEGIVRNFTALYSTEKIPEIQISMSGRSKFFAFGIDILGTEGRIQIGNGYANYLEKKESKLYSGFFSLEESDVKAPRKTGYFSNMIENAVDFLDQKSELLSPLSEAIKDMEVIEELKNKLK